MSDLFNPPGKPDNTGIYAGYELSVNPFAVDEDLATIGGDENADRFRRIICAHEIDRIASLIKGETFSDTPVMLWLKEDDRSPKLYNNVVTTGVFRALIATSQPRMLPIYVPVPQVLKDFSGNVFKLIADRLLPRYFKHTVYAFIHRELKRAGTDDATSLPFSAGRLAEEMDATGGRALDEILFGGEYTLTEAEEYGAVIEPEPEPQAAKESVEELADDEETAETSTSDVSADLPAVAETPVDNRKDQLVAFITSRLNDPSLAFGTTLRSAVTLALTKGFVKGRLFLQEATSPKDELLGLLRLIGYYYNGVVVMVDQLDPWLFFTEPEKIKFLSDLHEYSLISAGKAVFVAISNEQIYEGFDASFKARCETLPLRLTWANEDVDSMGKDLAKFERLLEEFLSAVKQSDGGGLAPFTRSGAARILAKSAGKVPAALDHARRLIDAGSEDGFPPIDETFVDKVI